MGLKFLLKRGGLLTAANWPVVAIQFAAQTTFQVLLAVPIVGATILVAVLLGADVGNPFQDSLRATFGNIADTLIAEPVALVAVIAAFVIVLVGGSVLMFLVKGGTVALMLAADEHAGPIEQEPVTLSLLRASSRFSVTTFAGGCQRFFRRYCALGIALMFVYAASAGASAYFAFFVYGSRENDGRFLVGWLLAFFSTIAFFVWITCVNLIYLLIQIACAAEDTSLGGAARSVMRFVRAEIVDLGGVFLVVCGLLLAAMFASALAWSGVALIAFVPLVGLAVVPLQIVALLIRGIVNEYIGLTAMGAYISLYRRFAAREITAERVTASGARPVSAG